MTDQGKLLIVHAACVAIIVAAFVIAAALLKAGFHPVIGWLVVGVGFWFWGKLGFKPAEVALSRILEKQLGVTLDEARQLTVRPPPPARPVAVDEVIP